MKTRVYALLVEDSEDDRNHFRRNIRKLNESSSFVSVSYKEAHDLSSAIQSLKEESFDVILLDLSLPDSNDLDGIFTVKEYCETTTPIIVLTGRDGDDFALKAIKSGAYDYLNKKDISPHNLSRSIVYTIERFKMALELENLRVQQAKTLKMATLGEMSGNIAHEINNPLSIIMGYADKLKRTSALEASHHNYTEFAEKIIETTDRVAKIVKSLKSYSRRDDEDPMVPTTLKSILDDTLNLCSEKLSRAEIDLQIDDIPEVKVLCKDIQLSQVFLNLLGNSHDAIKGLEEKWIQISFQVYDDSICIKVADSGQISNKIVRKKIFSPFFTTKEKGLGTGLGMSISKNIIDTHSGKIELLDNSENTTFKITLPILKINS